MSKSTNPIAQITNQLAVDIEIYDQFSASDHTALNKRLGSIAAGAKSSIQTPHLISRLLATASVKVNGAHYARFPIAVMVVQEEAEFTIIDDDRKRMEKTLHFVQHCAAFPDSEMVRHFLSILQDNKGLRQQKAAIDKFFARVDAFKICTWISYRAILTWQSESLEPWQGPYYLYSKPAQSGSGAANAPIKLVALVNITPDTQGDGASITLATPDGKIEKQAPKYDLALDTRSGQIKVLHEGSDPCSVALTPTWVYLPQGTEDNQLVPQLGSAMAGEVNGTQTIGTQRMRELPLSKAESLKQQDRRRAEHERWEMFDRVIGKVAELVTILIGLATVYIMYKQWTEGHGRAPAGRDTDDARFRDEMSERIRQFESKLDRVSQLRQEISTETAAEVNERAVESTLSPRLDEIQEQLEAAAEVGPPNAKLEALYSKLKAIEGNRGASLEELQQNLADLSKHVDQVMADEGSEANEELADTLQQTRQAAEQLAEQEAQLQRQADGAPPVDPEGQSRPLERVSSDPIADYPVVDG